MVVRIVNEFHNEDFTVIPNGNFTLTKYKRYVKRACSQRDCDCETKVYMKTKEREDADLIPFDGFTSIEEYWKRIDPVDLQLRDAGYGVKLNCIKCGEPIKLKYLDLGFNCRTLLKASTNNTHKSAEKINGKYYCGLCKNKKEEKDKL